MISYTSEYSLSCCQFVDYDKVLVCTFYLALGYGVEQVTNATKVLFPQQQMWAYVVWLVLYLSFD